MILTLEKLKYRLDYDPNTGDFVWLNCKKPYLNGKTAGTLTTVGYKVIRLDKKLYYCHRLAWLWIYGEWPPHEIDHIDLDKSNNKIQNLRLVDHERNMYNQGLRSNNKSKVKGVYWYSARNKWHVQITKNYKSYHIGYFDDLDAAKEAYANASTKYHGNFGRVT